MHVLPIAANVQRKKLSPPRKDYRLSLGGESYGNHRIKAAPAAKMATKRPGMMTISMIPPRLDSEVLVWTLGGHR